MSNATFAGSAKGSTDNSLMEGFSGNNKFLAMLQKYLLNDSQISSSLDKVTRLSITFVVYSQLNLLGKTYFTVCQNFLLSTIMLIFIFAKYSF